MLLKYIAIAMGGALGALTRYWVGSVVTDRTGTRFYYGTLFVNITACVIIGAFLTYMNRREGVAIFWRYLVAAGFIGAYSTFSTFEYETFSFLENGAYFLACLYVVLSVAAGLAATWAGAWLGRLIP